MRVIIHTVDGKVGLHEPWKAESMEDILRALGQGPSWLVFDDMKVVYHSSNIIKIVAVDEGSLSYEI